MAKPFLKWAGGKRQLISEIEKRLPSEINEVETYVEPFIGGGALLFHMLENYNFKQIHISDINLELVLFVEGQVHVLNQFRLTFTPTKLCQDPLQSKTNIWKNYLKIKDLTTRLHGKVF